MQKMIEGHSQIAYELEICRKYGIDYSAQKGRWAAAVERLHPKRLQLRVAEKIKETDTVCTLRLAAASGHLPPFQAGQYINIFVEIDGVRTARPYSISPSIGSRPTMPRIHLQTKRVVLVGFQASAGCSCW